MSDSEEDEEEDDEDRLREELGVSEWICSQFFQRFSIRCLEMS